MQQLFAFILLAFGFLPVSLLITRSGPRALILSPIITLALASPVAQMHVVFDTGIGRGLSWLMAIQFVPVFLFFLRKKPKWPELASTVKGAASEYSIAISSFFFSFLAYVAAGPPLQWDARSIWLSKASWLNGPSSQYLIAQEDSLSGHPEYPLTGPAIMAAYWELEGVEENLQSGVSLVAFFPTLMVALAAIYLLSAVSTERVSWYGAGLTYPLFGVVAFASRGMIGSGYMDVLLASTILALCFALIANYLRPKTEVLIAVLLLMLIGNNLKQEGFVFVGLSLIVPFLLIALASKRLPMSFHFVTILAFAFAADRFVWLIFSNFAGLPESRSTSTITSNLSEILSFDSKFYVLLAQLFEYLGPFNLFVWTIVFILAIASLGVVFRGKFSRTSIATILSLPISSLAMMSVVLLTYTLGGDRDRLSWWLGTSYERVIATPELLLAGTAFLSIVLYFHPHNLSGTNSSGKEVAL